MTSGDYGGLHDKVLLKLGDPVRPARLGDKQGISQLLNRMGIPHPLLGSFWPHYLVIPNDGESPPADTPIIGCVCIERVEDVALLRMLSVIPERRREGLGYLLVETAANKARWEGVRRLYLVTDTAQGYFGEKLGFDTIDRKDVDAALTTTVEYQMARNKGAAWMRKVTVTMVAAAIIAGGRGRRLGGVDKGTLTVDGQTFLERQLAVLRPLFSRVLLVTNAPPSPPPAGVVLLADRRPRSRAAGRVRGGAGSAVAGRAGGGVRGGGHAAAAAARPATAARPRPGRRGRGAPGERFS